MRYWHFHPDLLDLLPGPWGRQPAPRGLKPNPKGLQPGPRGLMTRLQDPSAWLGRRVSSQDLKADFRDLLELQGLQLDLKSLQPILKYQVQSGL